MSEELKKKIYYSNLKTVLKSKNITQDKLMNDLKLNPNFTSNLANAKIERLEMDKIIKICEYLECDLSDLISVYPFKPAIKERVSI